MTKEQEIILKLDVIIRLLALTIVKGKEVKEQVKTLHDLGISNKEIALILNKTQNTVNATLSQARRSQQDA